MLTRNLSRITFVRNPRNVARVNPSCLDFVSNHRSRRISTNLPASPWAQFEMAPVDPIVGLNEIFQSDEFPNKVIVGVGSYRDDVRSEFRRPRREVILLHFLNILFSSFNY